MMPPVWFRMTRLLLLLLLWLVLQFSCSSAFVVVVVVNNSPTTSTTTTRLSLLSQGAGTTQERVRYAGGGLPLVLPGDRRHFWDPAIEGQLGGTGDLDQRIRQGHQYVATTTTTTQDAQHWLEDIGIPTNLAKPTAPIQATVLERKALITPDAPGDIQHIVLQLPKPSSDNDTEFRYVEGQAISVIPPGIDDKTGKGYKPRLYSIASTRYGDLLDGQTVSLCVRRAEYIDPPTGMLDLNKAGVCSNYLCDIEPGAQVHMAGPVGKTMLLPNDTSKDIIMVATGTGIAPFRAFLRRLFVENTVARHMFTGKAWLILGVPTTGGLLYPDEFKLMQEKANNGNLEVTYAISREMKNRQGGKYYVQDVLKERADELFNKLDQGAVIYFCGLKGMMPGIEEALEEVAAARGLDWASKLKELKANHQWHVEVY